MPCFGVVEVSPHAWIICFGGKLLFIIFMFVQVIQQSHL
jgi:hypothetical protein